MAIISPAFNAVTSTSGTTGSGGTVNLSHTPAGSNRYLLVFILRDTSYGGGGPAAWTVTYNGVAMTQLIDQSDSGGVSGRHWYTFGMLNPPTGANNVSVTDSATGFPYQVFINAISYTSVSQFNPINTSSTGYNISSLGFTTTTYLNKFVTFHYGTSANTDGTQRLNLVNTPSGGQNMYIVDKEITTAGAGSISYAGVSNASGVSLAPVPPTGGLLLAI